MYVITLMGKDPKVGANANYERLYFEHHNYYPNKFTSNIENAHMFKSMDEAYQFIWDDFNHCIREQLMQALSGGLDYQKETLEIRKIMLKPGRVMDSIDLNGDYSYYWSDEYRHRHDKAILEQEKEEEKRRNSYSNPTS